MKRSCFLLFLTLFSFNLCAQDGTSNALLFSNPKKDWMKFFQELNSIFYLDTFVESGTYLGETSAKAAACFDFVYTIELCENYFLQAKNNLSMYQNVFIYNGDTVSVFPKLIPELIKKKLKPLFWLDGHFMSCMQDQDDQPVPDQQSYTPIIEELRAIENSKLNNVVILIDDIRLFGTTLDKRRLPKAGNSYYPLLSEICTLITKAGFEFEIMGDILIAYPAWKKISTSQVLKSSKLSRLYDGQNFSDEQILEAEEVIASATGQELESIQECYESFSKPWRGWKNKSPHYNLWYGLTLAHNRKYHDAAIQFNQVLNLGYDHWRVYWYLGQCFYHIGDKEASIAALKKASTYEPARVLVKKIENNKKGM